MSGMTSKKMLSMHVFSHLGMHVLDIRKVVQLLHTSVGSGSGTALRTNFGFGFHRV